MIEWFLWGLLALIPFGILIKVGLSLKDPLTWKVKELLVVGGFLVLAGEVGLFLITIVAFGVICVKISEATNLANWLDKEIK